MRRTRNATVAAAREVESHIARLRQHPRVWFVDGRDQGFEDWFITLRPGWHWEGYIAEHAHGFTTLREALAAIERAQSCDCDQCQREKAAGSP